MSLGLTAAGPAVNEVTVFDESDTVFSLATRVLPGQDAAYKAFAEDLLRVFPDGLPFEEGVPRALFVPAGARRLPDAVVSYHVPVQDRSPAPFFVPFEVKEATFNTLEGKHVTMAWEASPEGLVPYLYGARGEKAKARVTMAYRARDGEVYTIDHPLAPTTIRL